MRLLPVLLLLALPIAAPDVRADDEAAEAAPAGQLTKLPVLTRFVEAPYPAEAQAAGLAGSVLLEIDIDAEGRIARAEVIEPAGHGFDEAALEAVRAFEFEPAEIDHEPASVRLTYRYDFVLRPPEPGPESAAGEAELPVTLEGRVLERGTRVAQPGAVVSAEVDERSWEAVTDAQGRFELRLPAGSYRITVFQMGFDRYATGEEVVDGEVTEARYYIRRRGGPMEAVVRARREKKEVARRTISLEEIRKVPGTQGDAIRVVQNMPGVARTPLGLGPLVVRGGRPGDTRTYVDGQLVPLLFHFGGLTSVINADFLESLDFYPGNFPVRYGRSTAGAVDVNTRKGRRDRHRGYANINLMESTFFLEGPLGGSGAFMASVRRSYLEAVLPFIMSATGGGGGLDFRMAPRFWDYQLKLDYDLGPNELELFVFGSDDQMSLVLTNPVEFGAEGGGGIAMKIGFHRFTAQWKRKLGPVDHRLAFTAGVDQTRSNVGADISTHLDLGLLALREDLSWKLTDAFTIAGGADVLAARFAYGAQIPPPPAPGEFFNPLVSDRLERVEDSGFALQPALFVDAIVRPVEWLKLVPGVRYDYDTFIRRGWWNPRITGFADVTETVLVKAAVGTFSQPPTPEKLVRAFGNPNLIEEASRQYAAGLEWRFADLFSMDLQVYYKDLFNAAVRSDELVEAPGAVGGFQRVNWSNDGLGRAYGVELLLRRDPGKALWGWIALSLGQAHRRASVDAPWRDHLLNQRYNLIAVVSYKLPWGVDVGTRWRLTDGNTGTQLLGAVYDSDGDQFIPIPNPQRNTLRRPPFFQVDLRIDRRWVFDTWILDAYVDVLNLTNHDNVESATYNYDFTRERPVHGIPVFPAFGIRGEF